MEMGYGSHSFSGRIEIGFWIRDGSRWRRTEVEMMEVKKSSASRGIEEALLLLDVH